MKSAFFIISVTFLFIQGVYAETFSGNIHLVKKSINDATLIGTTRLDDVQANSISASGSFKFNMLIVKGDTTVNGYVVGVNGKFNTLDIRGGLVGKNFEANVLKVVGPVDLERITVRDKTDIQGPLKAKNTNLQDLVVQASYITLHNVNVRNIVVRQNETKQQVLRLKGKTTVHGNIIFDSGTGHVRQGWQSKIEGDVTGATVGKSKKTRKRRK